jgi:hypothetical protein
MQDEGHVTEVGSPTRFIYSANHFSVKDKTCAESKGAVDPVPICGGSAQVSEADASVRSGGNQGQEVTRGFDKSAWGSEVSRKDVGSAAWKDSEDGVGAPLSV